MKIHLEPSPLGTRVSVSETGCEADLSTGRSAEILNLGAGITRCVGFDVAPDGAILYLRETSQADLVLLERIGGE